MKAKKPKIQGMKKLEEFSEEESREGAMERDMMERDMGKEVEVKQTEHKTGNDEKKPREIVIPGQILFSSLEFLPGEGTLREGNNIIATRFGLLDQYGRVVKVIPLTGVYIPKAGDMVIGKIIDMAPIGWVVDINGTSHGILTFSEGAREFVSRRVDMAKYFNINDLVVAKIAEMGMRGAELTFKGHGLRKLENGLLTKINPNKVPRVIGKMGSMINLIKNETECNIIVGQNGIIWIQGKAVESEILARDAISFVEKNSHIPELTEKVEKFIKSRK